MTEPGSPATALRFELEPVGGHLVAHFDPAGEPPGAPDRERLLAAIAEAGWSALHRNEEAIERFLTLAAAAKAPVQLEIAERRDAHCEIAVAADAMSAMLSLTPAYGGAPATREDVARELRRAEVVTGLIEPEIEAALALGVAHRRVIARGRAPQPGRPAEFRSLVPEMRQRGPSVNERGIADYRELGTLVIVHPGDPLMRRIPATPGVAGEDVHGLVVPAVAGDDSGFSAAISGASPSVEDSDLLLADIAGQPVAIKHGVCVQPTITVPGVDLGSGNIDFDGTVNVKGDVAPGMHVRATGDVFVTGTVEAAQIEAGGDITVAAGAMKARLAAGGAVGVMFCENAVISAGSELRIGEVSLHSDLTADARIVIGKPGGRRSQLIGGIARTSALLQVGILGSSAGVHTHVEVGYHPQEHAQFAALQAEVGRSEARLESLQQVLAYTETLTDARHREIRERALHTLAVTEQAHVELLDRLAEAQAHLTLSENPRIVVGQAVHAGVDLRLGIKTLKVQDDGGPGAFQLLDDEIVYGAK